MRAKARGLHSIPYILPCSLSSGSPSSRNEASRAGDYVQTSINGEPPQISRELAQSFAANNTIIVTWANFALWDFVQSWAQHVRRQGEVARRAGTVGPAWPSPRT